MHTFALVAWFVGTLYYVEAAVKTSIYIDQIPIYAKLASCAQDRVSAIVRAQSSGCGDDRQLTSFACFCIDSSTQFASIISTAVKDQCRSTDSKAVLTGRQAVIQTLHPIRARATSSSQPTPTPTATGAVGRNVKSALEAFDSYCSRSTDLTKYQDSATTRQTDNPKTVTITSPPSSPSTSTTPAIRGKSGTPVAAIVVPVVVIPLVLGIALWFALRRRRAHRKSNNMQELQGNDPAIKGQSVMANNPKELPTNHGHKQYAAQHRFEMPQNQAAVELDAGASRMTERNERPELM